MVQKQEFGSKLDLWWSIEIAHYDIATTISKAAT